MTEKKSIRLAGKPLDPSPYVWAFFNSRDEEYHLLLPFIKAGLEDGDKAFHIIDPPHRHDHLQHLNQAGINVEETAQKGQRGIREWANAYLREGRFDQPAMLELIEEVLDGSRSMGFPLTPLVDHMEAS